MNSGRNTDDPTLVAAFRSALLHQGAIVTAIFLALLLAYGNLRRRRPVAASPSRRMRKPGASGR